MSDPASLATLDVLTKMGAPAFYTDPNLVALIACRGVILSLERGNCDASCSIYVMLSMVAGPRFGDYRTDVYRFGRLGYDLRRRTRTDAFPGQDLSGVWIWRSSLDETRPGRPRSGAPRVRGGEQERRPHLRRLLLPAIEHEPSCGGRSAFRGGARS